MNKNGERCGDWRGIICGSYSARMCRFASIFFCFISRKENPRILICSAERSDGVKNLGCYCASLYSSTHAI